MPVAAGAPEVACEGGPLAGAPGVGAPWAVAAASEAGEGGANEPGTGAAAAVEFAGGCWGAAGLPLGVSGAAKSISMNESH